MVSRGTGERGYGTTGLEKPTTLITTHPLPDRQTKPITLVTTSARVAKEDPLAQIKSGNKLTYVLAKRLAKQSGADDGLILNSDGNITETSSANIFWIQDGILRTPPQSDGVLPGITRRHVIDLATALGPAPREESVSSDTLKQAEAVFVTSATTGIRAIGQVDGAELHGHPLVEQLMAAYETELAKCTPHPS
jgi:branched-subunit amino acid aminotransferase/4-amino-4-deoxychorismate lyase